MRAFGGGLGGGKTTAANVECLDMAMAYPGTVGLIARQTYPELRDTTRKNFLERVCPPELIKPGGWNKTENILTLVNGSQILFRSLDDPLKFASLELGFFFIDQAEETTEEIFLTLVGRLRHPAGPRRGILTFNPAGHDWIWQTFVNRPEADYEFIPVSTRDNPYLPEDYLPTLLSKYPEAWVKRMVDGSFDVFEGQVYPDYDPRIHRIPQREIPDTWPRYRAIDHGYRNPTAVLWAALSPEDELVVYDEHYESGQLVSHHAAIVKARSGERLYAASVCDPSMAAKSPIDGRSVLDEYSQRGIVWKPGNNDVAAGILRVSERLKPDAAGRARLYITENCVNLLEELPQYTWRAMGPAQVGNEPEQPRKYRDHAVDALRYLVMELPVRRAGLGNMTPHNPDLPHAVRRRPFDHDFDDFDRQRAGAPPGALKPVRRR
ncbi:MAG: phage terminase large subunit [Pseudomonadota bacterium]